MRTLYVTNDLANSLTPINPQTGRPAGPNIAVDDPYNMYFTPDGRYAIVVAESRQNLDFRDPHTFALGAPDPRRLRGRGPHRLRGQRRVHDRHLRVRRPAGPHRPAHAGRGRLPEPARLGAAGHQAGPGRTHLLRRRQEPRRRVADRRGHVQGDRVHPHRPGRARPVPEPRRPLPVRDQPGQRDDLADQLRDQEAGHRLADPRRRQPGHGQPVPRREGVLGVGALRQRRLRHLHRRRPPAGQDPGGLAAARAVRVAPARAGTRWGTPGSPGDRAAAGPGCCWPAPGCCWPGWPGQRRPAAPPT